MVNVNKLKGKIVENDLSVEQLSAKIGVNASTIYRKMASGGESFTIEEATSIKNCLNLSEEEAMAIFFA